MVGKSYVGPNTRFYDVVVLPNEWIELRVCHDNKGVRKQLQRHLTDPGYFLGRLEAFRQSSIRAEQELATAIGDYRSYFAHNHVKIVLV